MTYRTQPALVLPRSPLIFVLAQVKISPVLAMKDKIPDIQEALRKKGYTRFQTRNIQHTRMLPAGGPPEILQKTQWEFLDRDLSTSVLVDTESVVLQTTEYPSFEDYIDRLSDALEVVAKVAEPAETLRIGLRYVDLVVPVAPQSLEFYIKPNIRVPGLEPFGDRRACLTENHIKTSDHTTLVVRYVEGNNGLAFPPDLLPLTLSMRRNPNMTSQFGLLDFDHFIQKPAEFAVDCTREQAWKLHQVLTDVFNASVTQAAIDEWRKQ